MQFEKPKPKPKPIEQSKPIVSNPIYGQKAPKVIQKIRLLVNLYLIFFFF